MVQLFFGFSIFSGYGFTLLQNTYTFFNGVFLKNSYLHILSRKDNFKNIQTFQVDISRLFSINACAYLKGGFVIIFSVLS